MESLIPIFRLLHFVGFALLLGGTLASIMLVKKEGSNVASIKLAHHCMHMLVAPGLLLLLFTGLFHSSVLYWDNFKGAGYMHAKVVLVGIILLLLIFDLRTQKKIIRSHEDPDLLLDLVRKRQALGISISALTLLVMWLVSFRPF